MYQSLKDAASRLLKRKGFLEKCELWKAKTTNSDYLCDVYDGKVWQDFQSFLMQPYSWCLALNVDWFQPFTHVSDSVGALYLVVLNLPREERYRKENMMLVGIIPGPHEPSLNINSYLTPLVLELQAFYSGVDILCVSADGRSTKSVCLRLALTGVFCDLPASRKVCGFLSFNSLHGCNRCLKSFPTQSFGERPNFCGYNRESWPVRDINTHREKSYAYISCNTKTQQKEIEREYGIRYTPLIELQYFNPIRHTVVDPMHNLFLGTAKHCLELWISRNILSKSEIKEIENRMSCLIAPHSVGRLPIKIASGFSGFTADQWKNWTVSYSSIVLRDILPSIHLQYWLLFVKACSLLCKRCLKRSAVEVSDQCLRLFCVKFQEVNGADACTPNMHMHLHLKECLLDYGPPYAFWCYAFERYNGMLGRFPTNQKIIESQLMKKCLTLQELQSETFPEEGEPFRDILIQHTSSASGSVLMSMSTDLLNFIALSAPIFEKGLNFTTSIHEKCLPPLKDIILSSDQASMLECLYKFLYPDIQLSSLSRFAKMSYRASVYDEVFGSKAMSRDNNIVISAFWPSSDNFLVSPGVSLPHSIGQIQYFVQHKMISQADGEMEHIFGYVKWYKKHEQFNWFGYSATVLIQEFEPYTKFSFIPVQRISSVCLYGRLKVSFVDGMEETVIVASPVNSKH